MSISTQIACDICGKARGTVNHWWIACQDDPRLQPCELNGHQVRNLLIFFRWDDRLSELKSVIHLCGQQCAQVLQSQWMEKVATETQ